ncbi:uncharacterized protein LOC101850422 [Aplysia californica]|uniref:Uncharacterized protein LOC101850422 n=1 Tax=Aplysia californica TaxID=6500 RepID=A0ABM1VVK4_APLCA|nr:uncharacterized protein LOC101850422 [Aplysia californica]
MFEQKKWNFCSIKVIFGLFCLWTVAFLMFFARHRHIKMADVSLRSDRLSPTTQAAFRDNPSLEQQGGVLPRQECIHPQLKVNDPVMMKFFRKYPPLTCSGQKDWIYVDNGTVRFSKPLHGKKNNFTCDYYPLVRVGDYEYKWGLPHVDIKDGFPMTSDFFRAVCKRGTREQYENIHAGVSYSKQRTERPRDPLKSGFEGLSIAILGFDSMSRMSWLRRLPNTRKYFHDELGAIELEAHNIVGDGTTAVMFPMLTGKFEWELPECRVNFKGATTLDKFPFIWHDMKKAGYLTSWANAAPKSAPFNWRMLGFKDQPTDFYPRPFYLAATPTFKRFTSHCLGSQTQSKVWLNWFRDIFLMYRQQRKFLFHFITDMSHDDNNLMTQMDDDIRDVVKFLHDGGYLNQTVLILMGDHGARYNKVRSTWSGKQEERLPYFSFLFPPWFERKYPDAMRNLRTNTKRLTTPFDLHETFKDFLKFSGAGKGNVLARGISLFKEIPLERSCEHADIAPHWCACLAWKNVPVGDKDVVKALGTALLTINGFTKEYRSYCALLAVANVTMATKLETRAEVLKFKKTDSNGGIYAIDMSDKNKNEMALYQLTFITTPGGGHFEVTVTQDVIKGSFDLTEKEISRINKYGDDPACILDKNRQIRQYCYCSRS